MSSRIAVSALASGNNEGEPKRMKDLALQSAPTGDIYRHMWLLKTMLASVGVDLGQALAEGTLDVTAYSQMLTKCRFAGCDNACMAWQANNQNSSPPDFCVNKTMLDQMSA